MTVGHEVLVSQSDSSALRVEVCYNLAPGAWWQGGSWRARMPFPPNLWSQFTGGGTLKNPFFSKNSPQLFLADATAFRGRDHDSFA